MLRPLGIVRKQTIRGRQPTTSMNGFPFVCLI